MEAVRNRVTLVMLFFLVGCANLFAQSGEGKLAGKIIDADTGEPLIGANVILLNTNQGAATNLDGNYFILNIRPGNYDVKFSYVGYSSKTIQDVRIVAGITYELNVDLNSGIELDVVLITSQKLFEENATNTIKVVDSEQISKLPVRGVTNVAALQSGVVIQEGSGGVDGNARINVRGGRSSEVLYIIDGVPQNNVLNARTGAQVSDNTIEQLTFQVGGYEAKYGQAQSGIINVTTKSGTPLYNIFVEGVSSAFTDNFGYNLYSANVSGPIIPGLEKHTIFLSAERGWYRDANPPAISLEFPTIDKSYDHLPNNSAGLWRFTARTSHYFGDFTIRLGANVNLNNGRNYIHSYAKNNSEFFPEFNRNNYSFSVRISQTISNNSYWNLTAGLRRYSFEQYDPHFKDDLNKWGDSTLFANQFGLTLIADGQRVFFDDNGIFFAYGRVNNAYAKNENDNLTIDASFTSQIGNHLMEFGGGGIYSLVRNYYINPINPVLYDASLTELEKYEALQPTAYGYDIFGREKTTLDDGEFAPKNPLQAYVFLQDRMELEDLVLNIGVRLDYFDTKEDVLIDPSLPFAGGTDPNDFDPGDFKQKDPEVEISPRIGIGFPVTSSTVFHAQYGRFIQQPALTDLYNGPFDLLQFVQISPQYVRDGTIVSEETTQYEVGFRQLLGDNAALNLTAFYKNIKGLVNRQTSFFQRQPGGEISTYIAPANSDFGTTKGFAFSLDVHRLNYISFSAQYTFSIAEGTGSSTNSSQTAVFRNQNNDAPKVIAPLDFDQRHTATVNIDFYVPKGSLGFMEMFNANLLLSFASGRPYTPLDFFDILSGNNGGPSTTGYVNSRFAPGTFRIDLKVEKSFALGDNLLISPYLWIENLLDADNVTQVWRSTGDPLTTGFLLTQDGQNNIENRGEGYEQDYISRERDPGNFGIPRQIRLGLKINFGGI